MLLQKKNQKRYLHANPLFWAYIHVCALARSESQAQVSSLSSMIKVITREHKQIHFVSTQKSPHTHLKIAAHNHHYHPHLAKATGYSAVYY